MDSLRGEIITYVMRKYGAQPERLWMRFPDYAVFRHNDNRKWFGIVMDVPGEKLGLPGKGRVEILNVKPGDPLLAELLIKQEGFMRGYHFSGGNWVSILLDGTVPRETIFGLIDESYRATASAKKQKKLRPKKEWLIPSNPAYYDIERAFDERDEIEWKQGSGVVAGDTAYMYVGAPISAIMYKCIVTETDIPYDYSDENLTIRALMKIKLQKRYDPERFTFKTLNEEFGIFAVRGPRGVPKALSDALALEGEEVPEKK